MKFRYSVFVSVVLLAVVLSGFQKNDPVRFFKGNLHTHSYWSDGNTFPEEVARWYRDHGYQFLAVTDHNILQEGRKTKVIDNDTVVLRELAGYRHEFEKPGEFLLLSAEEISDQSEKKPVHLNGFNLSQVVKPTGGATVAECVSANVRAIRQALEPSGNPEWIVVNHPNFGWGLTADALARCGARFFEVFNGHPSVRNYGDSVHIGTETMWDEANKWRIDNGEKLVLGIATDDAHQYDRYEVGKANPGRGWTMVRAKELTPGSLYKSMFDGDFYASTGVELVDFRSDKKGIHIRIRGEKGIHYTTEFIGWLAGKDHPEILKTAEGTKAVYRATGKELFVRARIVSGKPKANPFAKGDCEMAWVQPVMFD
ncbi:MAG: histidinol-phosphatase [Bacteroidia bacterium]|nr:histidinol-phosphatase [Bacteroidia bacterium]